MRIILTRCQARRRLGNMELAIALSFYMRPNEAIVCRTISVIPPDRRQTEPVRRRVALKVIKLGMSVPFSLLFAVHSLSLAAAPPELPTTPADKVLAGYLEALNSGNKNKLETFIKAHRPDRPNAVDIMLDLRWNTGGLDLYSIESSQPLNIQAVVLEREGGRYNRMSVSVTDANPPVITNISLMVIPPPPGAPVPPPASAIGPRAVAAQVEDRSGSRTVAQSLRPARGNRREQQFPGKRACEGYYLIRSCFDPPLQ